MTSENGRWFPSTEMPVSFCVAQVRVLPTVRNISTRMKPIRQEPFEKTLALVETGVEQNDSS
jgi:hypothetical protein